MLTLIGASINTSRSGLHYVSFSDGTSFIAEAQTYSILPGFYWEMTNHMPLERYENKSK
jgi:hypothetical protein|tara:strand:+ start:586 stop:762 length:177 start_codon:yes stop_codon:yes gene_type:complete